MKKIKLNRLSDEKALPTVLNYTLMIVSTWPWKVHISFVKLHRQKVTRSTMEYFFIIVGYLVGTTTFVWIFKLYSFHTFIQSSCSMNVQWKAIYKSYQVKFTCSNKSTCKYMVNTSNQSVRLLPNKWFGASVFPYNSNGYTTLDLKYIQENKINSMERVFLVVEQLIKLKNSFCANVNFLAQYQGIYSYIGE